MKRFAIIFSVLAVLVICVCFVIAVPLCYNSQPGCGFGGTPPSPTIDATTLPAPMTETPIATATPIFTGDEFNGSEVNNEIWVEKLNTTIEQKNGILTLSRQVLSGQTLNDGGLRHTSLKISDLGFVETSVMLDKNIVASIGNIGVGVSYGSSWIACFIRGESGSAEKAWVACEINGNPLTERISVSYNSWHVIRFEIDPDATAISFFIDGEQIGSDYIPGNPEELRKASFGLDLVIWSQDGGLVTGYVDYVRIGQP